MTVKGRQTGAINFLTFQLKAKYHITYKKEKEKQANPFNSDPTEALLVH